jgi:hypothetical protein
MYGSEHVGTLSGADRLGIAGLRCYPSSQLRTTTTSYESVVRGKPVSNLACTTASVRPNRAAAVGIWKLLLVMTFSTVPAVSSSFRRMRVIRLLKFCTAHNRWPESTMPSTFGTLMPAIAALAGVSGSTV